MKTIVMLLILAGSLSIARGQWDTKITPNMPSLEKAYGGRMEITRSAPTPQGVVGYHVKIYDPEVIAVGRSSKLCLVILVVSNVGGKELASVQVDFTGMATQPPSKEPFCCFSFNVHESCEEYSVVNLGSNDGMRNHYVGYKLPAKSISRRKEAEQDVPSDGHKPSSHASSADPAAPADAH